MPEPVFDPELLETPAYVYDLTRVESAYARLRGSLPTPSELYYSVKANPHPAVLTRLRDLGCRAEVSSPGELRAAVEAGFAPGTILYTGPAKRDADVRAALVAGVREFSVDSPSGLDQLDRSARELGVSARCLVRVNADRPAMGAGLAMTGVPSQFGADLSWVEAEPERFGDRGNLEVGGLHLYMATNLTEEDALAGQFEQALEIAVRLRERLGRRFRTLDLGGGFGAPFAERGEPPEFPALAARVARMLDDAFSGWREGSPRIVFESGRYLTATCGQLYTRVLDVKPSQGKRIIVLDTGVNHLGGMSGLRRLPRIVPDLVRAGRPEVKRARTHGVVPPAWMPPPTTGRAEGEAVVAGPLCTPLDTWARNGPAPEVVPGDLLMVPNVGAYALYASLVLFLGHPLPDEVVIDSGAVVERSRMTVRRETAVPVVPETVSALTGGSE